MKERKQKCGCVKSRFQTILCDRHANERMEFAAKRLKQLEQDYFEQAILRDLSAQQEKEQ